MLEDFCRTLCAQTVFLNFKYSTNAICVTRTWCALARCVQVGRSFQRDELRESHARELVSISDRRVETVETFFDGSTYTREAVYPTIRIDLFHLPSAIKWLKRNFVSEPASQGVFRAAAITLRLQSIDKEVYAFLEALMNAGKDPHRWHLSKPQWFNLQK